MFNYNLFLQLTRDIPFNLDKSFKKEKIPSDIRQLIIERDGNKCRLCGKIDSFGCGGEFGMDGDLNIHHIIPNGKSYLDNLLVLCIKCHMLVHLVLWLDGKWRHVYLRRYPND
jgi:5-methylcytosine-specific restriction endonuclease McrA